MSGRARSPVAKKKLERKTLRERIEEQQKSNTDLPPKGDLSKKSKVNQTMIDMTEAEIQNMQDLMLHDNTYLQDKSVKKVSIATLKRRQNMLN